MRQNLDSVICDGIQMLFRSLSEHASREFYSKQVGALYVEYSGMHVTALMSRNIAFHHAVFTLS